LKTTKEHLSHFLPPCFNYRVNHKKSKHFLTCLLKIEKVGNGLAS